MDRLVRLGFSCLILLCVSSLYAGGFFFGATGGSSGGGGGSSSCTISLNWGSANCSNVATCTATSTGTHTLTVPGGNPGTLKFSTDDPALSAHTAFQYSKNGGGYITVAENGTVTFANGDTIQLQVTGISSGPSTINATVTDNTTSASVGTFAATNTHI